MHDALQRVEAAADTASLAFWRTADGKTEVPVFKQQRQLIVNSENTLWMPRCFLLPDATFGSTKDLREARPHTRLGEDGVLFSRIVEVRMQRTAVGNAYPEDQMAIEADTPIFGGVVPLGMQLSTSAMRLFYGHVHAEPHIAIRYGPASLDVEFVRTDATLCRAIFEKAAHPDALVVFYQHDGTATHVPTVPPLSPIAIEPHASWMDAARAHVDEQLAALPLSHACVLAGVDADHTRVSFRLLPSAAPSVRDDALATLASTDAFHTAQLLSGTLPSPLLSELFSSPHHILDATRT